MIKETLISDILNERILNIQKKILSGELSLLDLELVPIFTELKDSINIDNLNESSKIYVNACTLLNKKFEELKNLLRSLDNEKIFLQYLKSNPSDLEISQLFEGCWRKTLDIDSLSFDFLETSKEKLLIDRRRSSSIEHLKRINVKDEFLLEISREKFTEKMINFFNTIKNMLPCPYDEIFKGEKDQIKIYQNFVYLLHLLQSGKISYEKNTNYLFLKRDEKK